MEWTSILFAGDLHKRPVDISTIEGYVKCSNEVQKSLMQLIKDRNIEYFVSLGDWYDKGYASDISSSLADYDLDIELSNMLNKKFYGLIGNHIRLSLDSNPELHLIQPHPYLRSRRATNRTEQIIKTPKYLRINDVQISFQHYSMAYDKVEQYKPERMSWAKYHIALFHTPLIVPNSQLSKAAYGYNVSSNGAIAEALENVDLAIVGDIHKPLGKFDITGPTRVTTMVVPGSLTNTDSGEANRHSNINLPLVSVNENSEVKIQFIPFDLKTNLLTFTEANVEKSRQKLKSLRGKAIEDIYSKPESVTSLGYTKGETLFSLNAFLNSKGYTQTDKAMIKSVLNKPEDILTIVKLYMNEGV